MLRKIASAMPLAIAMLAGLACAVPDGTASAAFTQSVIDDMTKPGDGLQLGYQRAKYAATGMGLMARGDYTPGWWRPANKALKSATWWGAIAPWWNVLPLQGNAATQTRVEIGTIATIVRNKGTQTWRMVFVGQSGWAGNYNANASAWKSNAPGTQLTVNGYKLVSYAIPAGSDTLHGGSGLYALDPRAIDGLIHCVAARLAGADVASARYAMWSGADWYPSTTWRVAKEVPEIGWVPRIVSGRLKKITPAWQSFCAAPLDVPGRAGEDRGYPADKAGVFMATEDLRANPVPPIPGLLP